MIINYAILFIKIKNSLKNFRFKNYQNNKINVRIDSFCYLINLEQRIRKNHDYHLVKYIEWLLMLFYQLIGTFLVLFGPITVKYHKSLISKKKLEVFTIHSSIYRRLHLHSHLNILSFILQMPILNNNWNLLPIV